MVSFRIVADTIEQAIERREEFYFALTGSPAYVNNEIILADGRDGENAIYLQVGYHNEYDKCYTIKDDNIIEDKEEVKVDV